MIRATPHCFMLLWHRALSALVLALASAGNSNPARIAMMATTTSNSISVNAGRLFRHETEDIMSLIPFSGLWWLARLLLSRWKKASVRLAAHPGTSSNVSKKKKHSLAETGSSGTGCDDPMKRRLEPFFFGFIALFHSAMLHAAAGEYDLIIRHGKIVDGSGNPWFYGDVAVKRDRIAGVGRIAGEANRVIEADGLVVAPGFIDMHSHSDWVLLEDGNAQSKIRQGVTTEVIGESASAGPFKGKLPARKVSVKGEMIEIRRLSDYFAAVERAGLSVNVASYVGEGQVWECVMGTAFDRPGPGEIQEMRHLVAEAMGDGAFGLSTALIMPPSSLATTEDLIELCQVAREHGGIYATHIRDEGLGVFDSVREAIQIGERAGVPVDILHLKIADEKYWGRMKEVVALIEDARRRGVNVQANG